MSANKITPAGIIARLISLVPEREIFLRTGGRLRFFHISTRFQLIALGVVSGIVLLWAAGTLAILWNQANLLLERGVVSRSLAEISSREAKVAAYRDSVDDIAQDIEQRQKALEQILRANLGAGLEGGGIAPFATEANAPGTVASTSTIGSPLSAASPEARRLQALHSRQTELEAKLADAAQTRLTAVEKAIRSFGLNPARLNGGKFGRIDVAQGGPFVPVSATIAANPDLREIATLLTHLSAMEATLAAIPSGLPTAAPMTTSSYGYRRDPFNGRLAYHGGMDFRGRHGQPITAAAAGKVTFVGVRSGYGNVIDVDHGNGLTTRYAHLSGFNIKAGQTVARGKTIGRMGSTGRSTGTHLHFEVHVNGSPVNPLPFLQARQDVLEVQQTAKLRISEKRGRG